MPRKFILVNRIEEGGSVKNGRSRIGYDRKREGVKK